MNKRSSSVELLRIIAMFFIIASHFSVHSEFDLHSITNANTFSAIFLRTTVMGYVGINVFMSIFGYFNITENSYSKTISRSFRIVLQVFFYSVLIYGVFVVLQIIDFKFSDMIKVCLPVSLDEYGFPTVYIIVALISPIINSGIINLSIDQRRIMLIVCLLIWSIIPTLSLGHINHYGTTLGQYILMYILGGIIRIDYSKSESSKKKQGGYMVGVSSICLIIVAIIYTVIENMSISFIPSIMVFYSRYSIFSIMLACGLLMIFTGISIESRIINIIGSLTFGIYLIHDNRFVRDVLWTDWLNCKQYSLYWYFPFYAIFIVICVFVICGAIEFLRKKCFDELFQQLSSHSVNWLRNLWFYVRELPVESSTKQMHPRV